MTFVIIGCIILLFGVIVFRGAPYVPTHRRSIVNALDLLTLKKEDLIIDLGSGDGNVLRAAAQRGYRALGYELNPVLYLLSKVLCLPQKGKITIQLRDFWLAEWPSDAKAVFVFLAGPHMNHLSRKLHKEMQKRTTPLLVVSHGFAIPGFLPKKMSGGIYFYELQPGSEPNHRAKWNPKARTIDRLRYKT